MENPFKFVVSRTHHNDSFAVTSVWQTLPLMDSEKFLYKIQFAQVGSDLLIRFLDQQNNILQGAGIAIETNEEIS